MSVRLPGDVGAQEGLTDDVFKQSRKQGTKYGHVGARQGLGSMLDGDIIKRRQETERENFGKGFVSFKVDPDKNGNYPPLNINSRIFYPDQNGRVIIVDDDILKREVEAEEERRAYLENIIEKAAVSDEICSMVLGAKAADLLGVGKDGRGAVTDRALIAVDARPSMIETYDPTSLVYAQAISKFKQVVKNVMPIVQGFTPANVQNQGESTH